MLNFLGKHDHAKTLHDSLEQTINAGSARRLELNEMLVIDLAMLKTRQYEA